MPETVRPPSVPASAAPDTARTLPLLLLAALASMAAQRIGDAMLPELSREFGVVDLRLPDKLYLRKRNPGDATPGPA